MADTTSGLVLQDDATIDIYPSSECDEYEVIEIACAHAHVLNVTDAGEPDTYRRRKITLMIQGMRRQKDCDCGAGIEAGYGERHG